MFQIEEELKKLPGKPGVYLMHDKEDRIIYVGKAINLKNRVRQYFQSSRDKTPKIRKMVSHIDHFEYIITDSELEALVLECNLIKEYAPKYNTMLKDDKAYPYIRVTVQEDFPRILFARTMKRDHSKYFGPYTSVGAVRDTLDLLHKIYRIRICNRMLPKDIGKERPCLNYHIHQCDAPCQGYVSKEEYRRSVDRALDFLKGNYEEILGYLETEMTAAAERLDFEEAASYRELLFSVRKVAQKQKITDSDMEDRDVIAYAEEGTDAVVQVFFIREGKMIGRDHFHLTTHPGETGAEILGNFVKQFYAGTPFIPREVFVQCPIEDEELIGRWLSGKRGQKVVVRSPKRGEKARLVELARENAGIVLEKDKEKLKREEQRTTGAAAQIGNWLGLPMVNRMEAFDISNISGAQSVGSMVVFEKGKPKRSDYRKFRIRTVVGPDDYASMQEVLTRRFCHGIQETEQLRKEGRSEDVVKFARFPDLILMDGGRGQVHVAEQVLAGLGLSIPVCGMVKDDNHRTRGLYYRDREVAIDTHSEGFQLLTRIQDEAHRFAVEYHRSLRGKKQIHSVLDDIPGIGPARRKALMKEFGDVAAIREADPERLKAAPGMTETAARSVYEFFRKPAQTGGQEQPDGD
ncbi:MAG: excinuclease ABC subunit UvrC [Lachnospiraceae bacterium]|nr:excinuclease ABC subunit UvrC [Lachnospiraceae bacterium]